GNHEYYQNDFEKTVKAWQDWDLEGAPGNFHFLYNDWRILDGVRFLGGTMWTDFNDGDVFTMNAASMMMNDYAAIRVDGKCITPEYILAEHDKFVKFLMSKFDETFNGPTVVMSHHSPGNAKRRIGKSKSDRL